VRRARLAFGGVGQIKEQSRDARGLAALDVLMQTVHSAWRTLSHRPGLVTAVSLTLALGLGANAAMFAVLDRLLFRPPPYLRDPGSVNRVYFGWQLRPGDVGLAGMTSGLHAAMPYPRVQDFARWATAFTQTAAFATNSEMAIGTGQGTREVRVAAVTASFFSFFDAPPVLGRYFTAQEDRPPQGTDVAVLGYALWRSLYGGRSDVLGERVRTELGDFTVIGVAPENFVGVGEADEAWQDPSSGYGEPIGLFLPVTTLAGRAYAPFASGPCNYATSYCFKWLQMIVRRRPGVSQDAASHSLASAFQRSYLVQRSEGSTRNFGALALDWKRLFPPIEIARPRAIAGPVLAARGPLESSTSRVATWIGGVVAIVLVITCANVASLLLASARERRREIAVRLALGVSRRRLVGQMLTECLLLAGIGGIAALVVARVGGAALVSALLTADAGVSLYAHRTLLFCVVATLAVGLAIGIMPALQARRTSILDALSGCGRSGLAERSRARALLLVLQGALSVVLLVGAGLFVRSVEHVRSIHLGFDADSTLHAVAAPWYGATLDSASERDLAERMISNAKAIPGVADAARAVGGPLSGTGSDPLFVPGVGEVTHLGNFLSVASSPEYFHTLGTRIVRGRGFTRGDAAHAPRVVVVSERMAQTLWPRQDAMGKRLQIGSDTAPSTTVVGIAENTAHMKVSGDQQLPYYLPIEQVHYDYDPGVAEVFIRTRGNARTYQGVLERALQRVMPGTAYLTLTPMRDLLDPQLRPWQLGATLFLAFGALALVVAVVGLYSVISYEVAQRRQELGIRLALGARTPHVMRTVAAESAWCAGLGVLLGGAIALAAAPFMAPLLFAESPRDPLVFLVVTSTLVVAVVAASAGPVIRASRLDPGTVLRAE
jgi:putative ABC transport system permease protein